MSDGGSAERGRHVRSALSRRWRGIWRLWLFAALLVPLGMLKGDGVLGSLRDAVLVGALLTALWVVLVTVAAIVSNHSRDGREAADAAPD